MKTKKKNEVFFVKETPENYQVDYTQTQPISDRELQRRLKASKQAKPKKVA